MLLKLIFILVILLSVLLSVAFYTLFERKILSLGQVRVGPNKVFLIGILQPALDGVKLLIKMFLLPFKAQNIIFFMSPIFSFVMMMMIWMSTPFAGETMSLFYSGLFFICCIGSLIYTIMLSGWGGFSKYSMMGAVRSCSQTVSYEINLTLLIVSFMALLLSIKLIMDMSFILFFLWPIWTLSMVAECNRAPMDLSEGESELISGFNIEFSSGGFVLLFLGEYGLMVFFSLVSSFLFFNGSIFMSMMFLSLFIVFRVAFPRIRYDKLMKFMWFFILPSVIFTLVIFLFI